MKFICTHPNCLQLNSFSQEIIKSLINGALIPDLSCTKCGKFLILSNQYLPLEQIGVGEFAITFSALNLQITQQKPAQLVVIKQLSSSKPLQPTQMAIVNRLFKKEIEILNNLQHPLIPQIYNYVEESVSTEVDKYSQSSDNQQNLFYLVEKYIDGENLDQEMQRKKFTENEILVILEQLLILLKFIHRHRIIHRNIKPSNIIRGQDGQLYLIDFGSIRQILQIVETGKPNIETLIMTPGFSPPEQENLKIVNFSSDLYSLAATCVYLLTGANPIKWDIPYNLDEWKKHTKVNKHFAAILDRMLNSHPQRRYQSANEVMKALDNTGLIKFSELNEKKYR